MSAEIFLKMQKCVQAESAMWKNLAKEKQPRQKCENGTAAKHWVWIYALHNLMLVESKYSALCTEKNWRDVNNIGNI